MEIGNFEGRNVQDALP